MMTEDFSVHIQIDPHTGVPVYRQIMDQIKYYQTSGMLKAGHQLPSIRELSKTLAVNPTTITKAYNELKHEGIIEMRKGKGAFLLAPKKSISQEERKRVLTRMARQIAVEAKQMGASAQLVKEIIDEALRDLSVD